MTNMESICNRSVRYGAGVRMFFMTDKMPICALHLLCVVHEVLMALGSRFTIFWNLTPASLVDTNVSEEHANFTIAVEMEASGFSEALSFLVPDYAAPHTRRP